MENSPLRVVFVAVPGIGRGTLAYASGTLNGLPVGPKVVPPPARNQVPDIDRVFPSPIAFVFLPSVVRALREGVSVS